jgi:hypothetical protein
MEFVLAALIGWCGTNWWRRWWWPYPWPWPWPWPGPPDPDPRPGPDPGPYILNGLRDGLIGAVAGVIAYSVLGNHFASAGVIGLALVSFAGGKVGADLIGGVIDMMTPKSTEKR